MSNEELARRAVACKGWRWVPGMLNGRDGSRYIGDLQWAWQDPHRHHALGIEIDDWPDLSDPPTLGGLLALVREAWRPYREHTPSTAHTFRGWGVLCRGEPLTAMTHTSEAEALVAALEAASCQ